MQRDLLDRFIAMSSTAEFVEASGDGRVRAANAAFIRHVAGGSGEVLGRPLLGYLTASDSTRFERWLNGDEPPAEPVRVNFVDVDGVPYTLRCVVDRREGSLQVAGEPEVDAERRASGELMRLNNELATLARERARRERELERTRAELNDALENLKSSFWHLQKLQEVLPLCMRCGRVKTDKDDGEWQTLVEYLKQNEILLSHAYCPSCTEAVMQEYDLEEAPTD